MIEFIIALYDLITDLKNFFKKKNKKREDSKKKNN